MNRRIFTVIFLAAASLISCSKDNAENGTAQSENGFRKITITVSTELTKTYTDNTGTLKWSDNDKLYIVPKSNSGTTPVELTLGQMNDVKTVATFTGSVPDSIKDDTELYAWCGGSWTNVSGSINVDMPAAQTYDDKGGLAKDAYPSIGAGTIKGGISLENPMGVLKITVKGVDSDSVKSITVTSAGKKLSGSFTVSLDVSNHTVSGGESNSVSVSSESSLTLSSDGVAFYVVVPPAEYAAKDLTVKVTFGNDEFLNNVLSDKIDVLANKVTKKETTVDSEKTGRHGILNGHEYVLIKAKYDGANDSYLKWATQNLAVTESGQAKWMSTNYQIGDYFLWGASYDGYGITEEEQKYPANLVIYNSFTNTSAGGLSDSFTFKTERASGFVKGNATYYNGTSYTKYTGTGEGKDGKTKLEQSDDVANIVLGDSWRIPTGGEEEDSEIKAMINATKWTFDGTDKGYYVTKSGEDLASDKSNALLFFPAAGRVTTNNSITTLNNVGTDGCYWSSKLYNFGNNQGFCLSCYYDNWVCLDYVASFTAGFARYYGLSVRPVSD